MRDGHMFWEILEWEPKLGRDGGLDFCIWVEDKFVIAAKEYLRVMAGDKDTDTYSFYISTMMTDLVNRSGFGHLIKDSRVFVEFDRDIGLKSIKLSAIGPELFFYTSVDTAQSIGGKYKAENINDPHEFVGLLMIFKYWASGVADQAERMDLIRTKAMYKYTV